MKAKNRLLMFGMILALMLGLANMGAWAQTTTFQPVSGNWNTPASWDNGVPTSSLEVVIPAGKTCILNTNTAQCNSLTVAGTLRPDNSSSRAIEVNANLTVSVGGQVSYTDPTLIGRISWTFPSTTAISNGGGNTQTNLQFGNLTIGSAGNVTIAADKFTVYGDFTVSGVGSFVASGGGCTVYFGNTSTAQTMTNNLGTLTFYSLLVSTGVSVTTNAIITISSDLTVQATASLAATSGADITFSGGTITCPGVLTFGTGSLVTIDGTTVLGDSISNMDGSITLSASVQLTLGIAKSPASVL